MNFLRVPQSIKYSPWNMNDATPMSAQRSPPWKVAACSNAADEFLLPVGREGWLVPAQPDPREASRPRAWKLGTSYGYSTLSPGRRRDAFCVWRECSSPMELADYKQVQRRARK